METWVWIVVIAAVVVVAVVAWLVVRGTRTRRLQRDFGSEYERTLARAGDRSLAESDLRERRERVSTLDLRPLSQADHDRFASEWTKVQAEFVDAPSDAVTEADELIQQVMATRGYPVEDFDRRAADVSVEHPHVVENYRSAHSIAVKEAREDGDGDTEALRKAMVYYRSLFDELLIVEDGQDRRN
jgi:ABC-type nickel/cobalt efflux system permease component RcnA